MILECPCEIWVIVFEFLSECDRRKVSVTCSLFYDIFNSFLKTRLLPHTFTVNSDDFIFDNLIIRWSRFERSFVVNKKFFDIFESKAEVLVNLNGTLTFSIPVIFHQDSQRYPNLKNLSPFSFTIIQTRGCRLKFTKYHANIHYVDGCDIEEIHSFKKRPCLECHFLEAIEYDLKESKELKKSTFSQPTSSPFDLKTIGGRVRYNLMGKRCEEPKEPKEILKDNQLISEKKHPNQSLLNQLKKEITVMK